MTHTLLNQRTFRSAVIGALILGLGAATAGTASYAFASTGDLTCPAPTTASVPARPVHAPRQAAAGSANLVVQVPAMTFINVDKHQIRTNTGTAPRPSDEFVVIQAHHARSATAAERAQALGCR